MGTGSWELESQLGRIEHTSLIQDQQYTSWKETLSAIVYETSGSTSNTMLLSPGQSLHQSFSHTSGTGTYSVDTISLYLIKNSFAQTQNITVTLSSGLSSGVLATASISSTLLHTSLTWESFHFGNITLNDGQTYYIKISSDGNDGLINLGVHSSNVYAGGFFYYDSLSSDANKDFAFEVSSVNSAPTVANAIPDQNATEDSAFSFQFASNTFNDVDVGNTLTYSSTLNGGAALPSWLTFNAATRTFSGTPLNAHVGTLNIDVTASDGNGGTVTDTFALVIANTNDAPLVANAILNQHATENSAFSFQFVSNTFSDPDNGDLLGYTAQLNGGSALPAWLNFDPVTRTFSGTPATADVGSLSIDVIATDTFGQSVTASFVLNIVNMNQAPTTTGIATVNTLENSPGDLIDLFAAFADREDLDAQLTYSIIGNTNSTLVTQTAIDAQTGKLQLHYGQNQFGTSQIIVRATDSQGLSVDASFAVNVAFVNQIPTSTGINNIDVIQGSAPSNIDLSSVFNDIEDGRNLVYSIINNSNPTLLNDIQINQQNHTSTIIYNANGVGETIITLRATDANGGFVDSTFKVTVVAQKPSTPIDNTDSSTPKTPEQNPNNNTSNSGPTTEPGTATPGTIGGGKIPDAASEPTDNTLIHNLIGKNVPNDASNITPPVQVNEEESFNHNRYDRILEQEIATRRMNEPLGSQTLISSLILPGEGFSATDAAEFNAQVRRIHQEMDNIIIAEQQHKALLSGLTLSLTTGILIWSLRASSLLLTLMSMLPLWRGIDPLPILEEVKKRKKDLEQQRNDKKVEDKNAKEVGYLFDNIKKDND